MGLEGAQGLGAHPAIASEGLRRIRGRQSAPARARRCDTARGLFNKEIDLRLALMCVQLGLCSGTAAGPPDHALSERTCARQTMERPVALLPITTTKIG